MGNPLLNPPNIPNSVKLCALCGAPFFTVGEGLASSRFGWIIDNGLTGCCIDYGEHGGRALEPPSHINETSGKETEVTRGRTRGPPLQLD